MNKVDVGSTVLTGSSASCGRLRAQSGLAGQRGIIVIIPSDQATLCVSLIGLPTTFTRRRRRRASEGKEKKNKEENLDEYLQNLIR